MDERRVGQIAEYGTDEFKNNQSIRTVLKIGKYINPHNISFKIELYHRTQGYKPAGSCAIWGNELWGYTLYYDDGTTGGRNTSNKEEIFKRYDELTTVTPSGF
jgi:hypothetical protein